MRAATDSNDATAMRNFISIHAAHAGCDFQCQIRYRRKVNFNPRSPCGLRLRSDGYVRCPLEISIHAAHAGCDKIFRTLQATIRNFNPRSPCGLRLSVSNTLSPESKFQSTQPMRAATQVRRICTMPFRNFNPRSPCGLRPTRFRPPAAAYRISIHAAHAGCDYVS